MMYGLDFLGLPRYAKVAKETFPNNFALGCFSSTFGDSRPAVEAILDTGKCAALRVHLMWKDNHLYTERDISLAVKEAKKWREISEDILFYVSPWCEWQAKVSLLSKLHDAIMEILPHAYYVNTPEYPSVGTTLVGVINEVHGNKALPVHDDYIMSFDGSAVVDSDIEGIKKRHFRAKIMFFWEPRFNGRWETTDTTPRPKRKGWPDKKLIKSVIALSECCCEVHLPPKWLYKSHAENKGNGDPRAEKPLIIAPVKAPFVMLRNASRTVLAKFKYYGPYEGGGYRYYNGKWGYEIALEPLQVWANNRQYGVVNPAFRCGGWR